jgi:oligopeptide/dipeptide ABC transporter ATP-binding protein
MYLGRIVEYGSNDELINNPKHPYTQALLSNCASIDPNEKMKRILIEGEPPTPINPGPGCYFASRCFKAEKSCFNEYPATYSLDKGHLVACDRYNL